MPFPREPVGLRNLITPVANRDGDIAIVLDLLNRVDVGNGGTGGLVEWPTDKSLLLPALALAIQHFQIHNELPSRDGVVDPNGTTGKELNRHARGAPLP